MDVDFCDSRINPSKHFSASQSAQTHYENHIVLDDSDGEDDARACFPCPFCYVNIEVTVLCGHFQEEHCFDLKNAVCPLCAANLGKDVIGHFIVQHASSIRWRRFEKPSSSTLLGKKLQTKSRGNRQESAPDPVLSPFICSIPFPDSKVIQNDEDSVNASEIGEMKRGPCLQTEGSEEENERMRQRAGFVQQLMDSIIFMDFSDTQ